MSRDINFDFEIDILLVTVLWIWCQTMKLVGIMCVKLV